MALNRELQPRQVEEGHLYRKGSRHGVSELRWGEGSSLQKDGLAWGVGAQMWVIVAWHVGT